MSEWSGVNDESESEMTEFDRLVFIAYQKAEEARPECLKIAREQIARERMPLWLGRWFDD